MKAASAVLSADETGKSASGSKAAKLDTLTIAPRPAFSVLGNTRSDAPVLPAWQEGLAAHLIAKEVLAS